MTVVTLTALGANNWTVPADCVKIDNVDIVAGGGSGRGNPALNPGFGGGGGENRNDTNISVIPGAIIGYNIGDGGAATFGTTGNPGQDTTFALGGGYTAKAGQGAGTGSGGAGGTGGSGGTGSAGQAGAVTQNWRGGAAGTPGQGSNGAQQVTAGADGLVPGGGSAGGASAAGSGTNASGKGARGEIRITYTPVVTLDSSRALTFATSAAMQIKSLLSATRALTFGTSAAISISTPAATGRNIMGRIKSELMFFYKPTGDKDIG